MPLDPQLQYQNYNKNLTSIAASSTINTIVSSAPAAAITSGLTTLTVQTPAVADYNISFVNLSDQHASLSDSSAAIFGSLDEAKTVGLLVKRLQTQMEEVKSRLQTLSLIS